MNEIFVKAKATFNAVFTNRLSLFGLLVALIFVITELRYGDAAVRVAAESSRIAIFAVLASMTFTAAWGSFLSGTKSGAEQMAVAVFGISMAIFIHAVWVPVSKYTDWPYWFEPRVVTTGLIIGVAMAGLGYLIPISNHRRAAVPLVGSWAGVFLAGLIAGALMGAIFATGGSFFE